MRWSITSQAVQAKAWRERPLRYTFGLWMPKACLSSNVPTSLSLGCKRSHFTATLSGNLSMRSPNEEQAHEGNGSPWCRRGHVRFDRHP